MIKSIFYIILIALFLTSCNEQNVEKDKLTNKTLKTNMTDSNFESIIKKIRTSDIYENPNNWKARGLNPSEQSVILILRKATNDFLKKLEKIYNSKESSETKLNQVSNIVDELPWDELDTEEKEFIAEELAPAIQALGFDPWTIF
ncbi:hypothetical protein [uncultured Aquimarina sp.]|uniref:hypothetical protein n=1 Tax=uncultured Aquimarina sp. TaxID=575652 RepID=UPI00262B148B|nr:hypothetical protein [uncultured Aquimarina sp.]